MSADTDLREALIEAFRSTRHEWLDRTTLGDAQGAWFNALRLADVALKVFGDGWVDLNGRIEVRFKSGATDIVAPEFFREMDFKLFDGDDNSSDILAIRQA